MIVFADRLTKLRLKRNLRQTDLARYLHISTSAISNYEQSIRYPDIELLVQIADFFGVSTDYLLGRTNVLYPEKEAKG